MLIWRERRRGGRGMKVFNLNYTHKESGKVIKARTIERSLYRIQHQDTLKEENITRHFLIKEYIPSPENRVAGMRATKARGTKRRIPRRRKENGLYQY
jgi:hypothetical protein